MKKKKIILDAGHGMRTAGKRTPNFTDGTKSSLTGKSFMHEFEFNKKVVLYLKEELERNGFEVETTLPSNDNVDVSLSHRVSIANRAQADLFASIHANALTGNWESKGHGIETFSYKSGSSVTFADLVQKEMIAASGLKNRGRKDGSKYYVIKYTNAPAILVECGFMDNLKEAKLLLSDSYRRLAAKAIAKGICKGFGVTYKESAPVAPKKETVKQTPSPSYSEGIYRVKDNGKQIGAFESQSNALLLAKKLFENGAKKVEIEYSLK